MACSPTSDQSRQKLRELIEQARQQGDECLAVLLAGVNLFVSIGREMELLEVMRDELRDLWEAVRETPTAEELERLFRLESPGDPKS